MTPGRHQPSEPSRTIPTSRGHVRFLVIGAGFSGLAMAARLRQRGETDLLVLERAEQVGGTWHHNTYPGAACDIRSDLYSFSFAQNPDWTSLYAGQAEIKAYLERTVDDLGLRPYLRLGTEVREARWDDEAALWRVGTDQGSWTAEVLVSGAGPLVQPRWPAIPGLDTFTGPRLHSSAWDHDVDLRGVRVAVIGTGASAAQLVPQVARQASHLTVFQRTPPWVVPRRDRGTSARRRELFRRFPPLQRLSRERIFRRNDLTHLALADRRVGWLLKQLALAHLRHQVADPVLRAALTPTYRPGCKRLVVSDDYYPALARDDVDLVTADITEVTATRVRTADGTAREVDVLVCSTGYLATDPPVARILVGRDGRTLAEHWADGGMQALRGTTVAGFPNLVFLVGPNTALGHNSIVHIIESQVGYALQALDRAAVGLASDRRAVVEPTLQAQQRWSARMADDLASSVWVTGGCTSFYLDSRGRNTTLWPHRAAAFRRAVDRVDPSEYHRRVVPTVGAGVTDVTTAGPAATDQEGPHDAAVHVP